MKQLALAAVVGLSFGLAPASAHHQGHCYVSGNGSHLCYVRTGKQEFSVALTDGSSVKPSVLAFHCANGWSGAGEMPKETMALVVEAICSDHGQQKSPTTSVAGLM